MKKDFPNKDSDDPYQISYENYLNTNACTECTGLMYSLAHDREEWSSYHEIFDFAPKPPHSKEQNE